jgi:hypothetical protein
MIKRGIENIVDGNIDEGLELLTKRLSQSCTSLIIAKTRLTNRNEALSIFYESLLIFIDQIKFNKFSYIDDARTVSYYNTLCLNKAREYCKVIQSGYILDNSLLDENKQEYLDLYEETRREEYNSKKVQGFDIQPDKTEDDFPIEVVNAFHNLKEKCKFLIILKYKLKLKHDQIVEALTPFFQIKNKEVSKAELQRCMTFLKTMVDINLDTKEN